MKAIILAAGMGTRLGKYTKDLPKGMLEFLGRSLIQRQVDTLRACNITDITIITGFESNKIKEKINGVKYYHNPDFATTNMVATLFCAEQELHGDVLVCYADILYEQRVINQILQSRQDVGVTADEDYWEYWSARLDNPQEDVESFVVKDNKLISLGKPNCAEHERKLRYVGLIKFSSKGIEALKRVYHKNKTLFWDKDQPWLNSKSFRKAYMTDMIQSLIDDGLDVRPIIIKRGWMEFDTVEDYERALQWHEERTLSRFISLDR